MSIALWSPRSSSPLPAAAADVRAEGGKRSPAGECTSRAVNRQPLEPGRTVADHAVRTQRIDLVVAQAEDAGQHLLVVLAQRRRGSCKRQEVAVPTKRETHVRGPTGNRVLHPL